MELFLQIFSNIATAIGNFGGNGATEDEINENIDSLTSFEWFNTFLQTPVYEKQIRENENVRYVIGKVNVDKVSKDSKKEEKTKKKIEKVLLKETT